MSFTELISIPALLITSVTLTPLAFITMTVPHAIAARFKVERLFKFYWTLVAALGLVSLVLVWFGL